MSKLHHDSNCQMTDPDEIQETKTAFLRAKDLSNIRFVPWIGRKYGRSGLYANKRIMILGESHYEWCELCAKNGTPRDRDLTCWLVAELVVGKKEDAAQHRQKIEYALNGKNKLDKPQREEFWNSVVYYNFVQEIVGQYPESGRAPPPTRQMWEDAKSPFLKVLDSLSPDLIIVLGFRLWTKLPDEGTEGQLTSINKADKELERCLYHRGRKEIIACRVRHPAAGLGSTWHPVLSTAIANL